MAFYASKKVLMNSLLSWISLIVIGLAFQNCSTQFSSDSLEAQASLNTPNRVIDDGDGAGPIETSELKIELYATTALQEDCSVSGEHYQFEILNSSQDITMCTEYVLDMPEGYPIQQESYSCNDININDKFVPPSSKWSYSVSERKWSFRTMANSIEQMPGDYRLYVRSGSNVAKSALLRVRRSGYANCGSQTARYVVPQPTPSPTPTPMPTPNPSPNPGPVTPGSNGACNPPGTTLVEVQTDLPNRSFQRTNYANIVTPLTVYAFSFRTPSASEPYSGALVATKLSNSIGNKYVIISTCKGDIRTDSKDQGCARYDVESTSVYYVVNGGNFKPNLYCNLKPNTQYYANVVSPGRATGLGVDGCTSVINCGFSFNGQ